jgi:multicomponent Na+:H+ antiporter subunit E
MKKFLRVLDYILFFSKELLKANYKVSRAVLRRKLPETASFVKVPTDLKNEWSLFIYANSITLTPGTISVEIAEDKKSILVHTLFLDSTKKDFIAECRDGFEKRLKGIFK